MGWDGAGAYNRVHNFSADASAGIKILASRMDAEINDIASAIPIAWARNGQNVPTVDMPMGGKKFVNVGAPTSVGNFMRVREFIENVPIFMQDVETSADRISVSSQYFTSVSANQAPVDGTKIMVRVNSNKSSAVLYVDGHSANVTYQDGNRIGPALVSGGIYEFTYSSVDTAWVVPTPSDGRTAAESAALVTPTNYQYEALTVDRYATNTTPGTTDMTLAIRAAISVAAAAGGGTINFLPGATYLLSTVGTHSVVVPVAGANFGDGTENHPYNILLDGLDNIVFSLNGALILSDATSGGSMFLLDSCRNVEFRDGGLESQTVHNGSGTVTTTGMGAISVTSQDRNSYNIALRNLEIKNAYMALYVFGTQTRTFQVRGLIIENLFHDKGIYTIACHMNGDNLTASGVHSSDVLREYFIYGVDNHEVQISSDTGVAAFGSLIKVYHVRDTRNIRLKLTTTRNVTAAAGNVTLQSQHVVATQAVPNRLIGIDIEVNNAGTTAGIPVQFDYYQSAVLQATSANNLFTAITLKGVFDQPPVVSSAQTGAFAAYGTINTDGVTLLNGSLLGLYIAKGFLDNKQSYFTFVPELKINGSATGITYGGTTVGEGWRDGQFMELQVKIVLTNKGASVGAVTMTLPYASSLRNFGPSVVTGKGNANMASLAGPLTGHISASSTAVALYDQDAAGATALDDTNLTNTSDFDLRIRYPI